MVLNMFIQNGVDEGLVFNITSFPVTVGIEPADHIIHGDDECGLLRIELKDEELVCELIKGTGFTLNNESVNSLITLNNGDLLRLGKTLIYAAINTSEISKLNLKFKTIKS